MSFHGQIVNGTCEELQEMAGWEHHYSDEKSSDGECKYVEE